MLVFPIEVAGLELKATRGGLGSRLIGIRVLGAL